MYTARCNLYKIGAATTFIKHRDYVERVESSSLPVGVTHRLETGNTKKQLENGDFLVMMTDGVLEYLQEEDPAGKAPGTDGGCNTGGSAGADRRKSSRRYDDSRLWYLEKIRNRSNGCK